MVIADVSIGGQPYGVGETDDDELAELAALMRERNAVDSRIAAILDRPVHPGHIAEFVAARIFDIELEIAANATAIDGRFTAGPLAGKTVNIKYKGRDDSLLDMTLALDLDFYLVFTGERGEAVSSRGTVTPFCVRIVYLFYSRQRACPESRGIWATIHGEL
jgi:hypothetical protein